MRIIVTVTVAGALIMGAPHPAAAQQVTFRGFASGGPAVDDSREKVLVFGGGVLADVGQPWVSAGAQGEALTSGGYFAGRGAVFAQVNPLGRKRIRPFIMGGMGLGVIAGPLIGGGLGLLSANRRLGFRVSVEDYIARNPIYDYRQSFEPVGREISHQVSVKLGVLSRVAR